MSARHDITNYRRFMAICLSFVASAILSACASSAGADPVQVVEQYLNAKVVGDREALQAHICAAMEDALDREALSFSQAQSTIEDMRCTFQDEAGVVSCTGRIVALYGLERREFPLDNYLVVREDDTWKWCGVAP